MKKPIGDQRGKREIIPFTRRPSRQGTRPREEKTKKATRSQTDNPQPPNPAA